MLGCLGTIIVWVANFVLWAIVIVFAFIVLGALFPSFAQDPGGFIVGIFCAFIISILILSEVLKRITKQK